MYDCPCAIGSIIHQARALWRRMVASVAPGEQTALEGSPYRFVRETSRFLARCGLDEAAADLLEDAEAGLRETLRIRSEAPSTPRR